MKLFDQFKDAILNEQKEDIALTTSYINNYPPKKLAQLGLGIINLQIVNVRTGLGGKTILELQLDPAFSDGEINTSTLRTGDIVKLAKMTSSASNQKLEKKKPLKNHKEESQAQNQSDVGIEAVVIKVSTQTISISVDESTDDSKILQYYNNTNDSARMWLVKLTNSITYKRMISTMDKVLDMKESDKNDIHKILLGESQYIPKSKSNGTSNNNHGENNFFNDQLNASQRQAIEFAINDSNITIIHGPPGTGKTYTLIELIQQLTSKGEKVLVCGPSNISVDTILERLGNKYEPMKLIRIGHPARLLVKNLQHSLEILSKTYGREIINDISSEIQSVLTKIKKCKKYGERKALYSELKLLKKELRQRERKIVNELLVQAQVVVATLHGSGSFELKNSVGNNDSSGMVFDTIIIDEVSQSLEPQCWIPLLLSNRFKRLVIAGDNMQLPPTIKKQKSNSSSSASILATTLFDRLVKHCQGDQYKKLLDVQYRMNKSIMQFPSMQLYDNQLKCDDSVRDISLVDLPGVEINDDTMTKCIWYDTEGGEFPEQISESVDGDSKYNDMELLVVKGHIKKLLSCGVRPQDIGVIAPYSAQVQNLKKQMGLGDGANGDKDGQIEISTVDGFQGREKEVIILTLVRSNDSREIGFLSEQRRLNVAMTRPKRQLCVVGDLELMNQSGNKFLQSWSKFVEDGNNDGEVIFEIDYPNLDDYIES
ncbi:conserved hypothetical protein [Candida dubliniensis CD36]|uniref:DNA helicase n=1 Tax=Candida dubliniensis (strain CD36 / ATCC MYA-646 / CBS 7987 / NCPF 3949 / NRRL Y-17841) TaxID=573826 RepID=B9W896_CANDC|nr:conserved hypothetical protein [Candida dubliniensis CD36]CAX44951.1 conserved hypothetical protein [Candida dubliniensis CD36]